MIIRTSEQLTPLLASIDAKSVIAVDTETRGLDPTKGALLGISLCFSANSAPTTCYIPTTNTTLDFSPLLKLLTNNDYTFVGHNFTYDQKWLKCEFDIIVPFAWDTQIMWHLSDAPYTQQSYSLKAAMTKVLGWKDSNQQPLFQSIIKNGGSPKNGDYYLADQEILAEYAELDAKATYLLFMQCKKFFDEHTYWQFLEKIQKYKNLLEENTSQGIPACRATLEQAAKYFEKQILAAESSIRHGICKKEIDELEKEWRNKWVCQAKTERGRRNRETKAQAQITFNISSGKHIETLLFGKLGLEAETYTEKGKAKTDKTALKNIAHPASVLLLKYNKNFKLLQFCKSYLEKIEHDTIYPRFNITGTVSGRISGYSPNMQQAPFKEKRIMESFKIPSGWVGIQADLVSIEPFFTAYFSEDPTLLKVYRDGLGDIYLDLALNLFPDNEDLKREYDPFSPPSSAAKDKFSSVRNIAKTVHLACQYGAGGRKIAQTLSLNGFPTTEHEGKRLHHLYWDKFKKVKQLEQALYNLYKTDWHIVGMFGRIIRISDFWCKDLLNRFIQSTAHDALMQWVLTIADRRACLDFPLVPVLVDVHDATAWRVLEKDFDKAVLLFQECLDILNKNYPGSAFAIKAEYKKFYTLADWK